MCQRVKRYLQKRLVELRDNATTLRQEFNTTVYSGNGQLSLEYVEALYKWKIAEVSIEEVKAVLAVMNESPLRVIETEEPNRPYDKVSRFELPESLMHAVDGDIPGGVDGLIERIEELGAMWEGAD